MQNELNIPTVKQQIEDLCGKIDKKRNELRELVSEAQNLVDSLEDAEDSLNMAHRAGKEVVDALDYAADALSQYV